MFFEKFFRFFIVFSLFANQKSHTKVTKDSKQYCSYAKNQCFVFKLFFVNKCCKSQVQFRSFPIFFTLYLNEIPYLIPYTLIALESIQKYPSILILRRVITYRLVKLRGHFPIILLSISSKMK